MLRRPWRAGPEASSEPTEARVIVQGVVRSNDPGQPAMSLLLKRSSGFPMAPMERPSRPEQFLLPPFPIPEILAVPFPW
jgi:hypothetical protein